MRQLIEESEARMKRWIKKYLAEQGVGKGPDGQLVSSEEKRQIVVGTMNQVRNYIQKEVLPKVKDLSDVVKQMQIDNDGVELVTEYRRRLCETTADDRPGEVLKIVGTTQSMTPQQQARRQFQRETLFFNDDD